MAGEQVFRIDLAPIASDGVDQEGTYFYSSPKFASTFRISQVLIGGSLGMTVCARGTALSVGREECDLNFPHDSYVSPRHCTVEAIGAKFRLTDHDTLNGTYLRIKSETALGQGDYVAIGRKLMRVELNA
jgi:predicted component of type VI protein secretion system